MGEYAKYGFGQQGLYGMFVACGIWCLADALLHAKSKLIYFYISYNTPQYEKRVSVENAYTEQFFLIDFRRPLVNKVLFKVLFLAFTHFKGKQLLRAHCSILLYIWLDFRKGYRQLQAQCPENPPPPLLPKLSSPKLL